MRSDCLSWCAVYRPVFCCNIPVWLDAKWLHFMMCCFSPCFLLHIPSWLWCEVTAFWDVLFIALFLTAHSKLAVMRSNCILWCALFFTRVSYCKKTSEVNELLCLFRCLEKQPDNLTTLMALAVSYTNESMQAQVHNTDHFFLLHMMSPSR